jgi:hypothetical protein
MLDLAKHIVQTKSGHFEPDKFEDHYEKALREVINSKAKGEKIEAKRPERPSNVINLMDALKARRSRQPALNDPELRPEPDNRFGGWRRTQHRDSCPDFHEHQVRRPAILGQASALVCRRRERADLRSLVAGCLVEFSLDAFVELRREQLQPHKPPAVTTSCAILATIWFARCDRRGEAACWLMAIQRQASA